MGRVDADDKLFASITRKRHFELMPLLHLPCREPFFICNLVVDPRFKANLDKIADGYAQYLSDAIAAS